MAGESSIAMPLAMRLSASWDFLARSWGRRSPEEPSTKSASSSAGASPPPPDAEPPPEPRAIPLAGAEPAAGSNHDESVAARSLSPKVRALLPASQQISRRRSAGVVYRKQDDDTDELEADHEGSEEPRTLSSSRSAPMLLLTNSPPTPPVTPPLRSGYFDGGQEGVSPAGVPEPAATLEASAQSPSPVGKLVDLSAPSTASLLVSGHPVENLSCDADDLPKIDSDATLVSLAEGDPQRPRPPQPDAKRAGTHPPLPPASCPPPDHDALATPPAEPARAPSAPPPLTEAERHLQNHPLPPAFLAAYDAHTELGSGGFGFVLGCRRRSDGLEVAAKVMPRKMMKKEDGWSDDADLGPVPTEVYCLKNFPHPGIVRYLDYYSDDRCTILVMERHGSVHPATMGHVHHHTDHPAEARPVLPPNHAAALPPAPGRLRPSPPCDLFEAIELYGPFCELEAAQVFAQLVDAVEHLWKAGWLHRDLKDENVVVDMDSLRVKLIDFGSACEVPCPLGRSRREVSFERFYGTMTYASPEVLSGKRYRGEAQETWSLGIVLYCLLFGEAPFETPQQVVSSPLRFSVSPAVLAAVRAAHPSQLSLRASSPLLRAPIPPATRGARELMRGMLERDPARRMALEEVGRHPWVEAGRRAWAAAEARGSGGTLN